MNEVPVFLTISVIAFCQMFNNPPYSVPKLNINHLSFRGRFDTADPIKIQGSSNIWKNSMT